MVSIFFASATSWEIVKAVACSPLAFLLVPLHVNAGIGEGVLEARSGGIQRRVLDDLIDADGVKITGIAAVS